MTRHQPAPVLEIAYEVLSRSDWPLSAEQIALLARQRGYGLTGRMVQAELDSHLRRFGYRSPFVEIGRECYGLLPLQAQQTVVSLDFSLLRPLALALTILLAVFFAFVAPVFEIPAGQADTAIDSAPPPAERALSVDIPVSVEWWTTNAINQLNPETQEVARQYLSNYYNTCGPAVVAMLANYYHSYVQSEGKRISTARVLRDAKRKLGYYNPPYNSGLLTFDHLRQMLHLYRIEQAYPKGGGELMSIEELLEGVRQGRPAIVGMRYGYRADGWRYLPAGGSGLYNHFVIVFGVALVDGQELLWLYNPHPAKYSYDDSDAVPGTISIAEFVNSWALNDGSENADRGHAVFFQSRSE